MSWWFAAVRAVAMDVNTADALNQIGRIRMSTLSRDTTKVRQPADRATGEGNPDREDGSSDEQVASNPLDNLVTSRNRALR